MKKYRRENVDHVLKKTQDELDSASKCAVCKTTS